MKMKLAKIPVMEVFGPTIQGEGPVIGQKTIFVRTGGCDYRCSWCDSKFTWDGSEKPEMLSPAEVYARVAELVHARQDDGYEYCDHVTISGGNPALIGEPMQEFIDILHEAGMRVGLETQGSRWQDWFRDLDDLVISPKPPSSGMSTNWVVLDSIMTSLPMSGEDRPSLKVVVFDDADWEYAKKVHKRYPWAPMFVSVGNPLVNEEEPIALQLLHRLEWLFDKLIHDPEMNNVRALPQLHTLVWGNRRKV